MIQARRLQAVGDEPDTLPMPKEVVLTIPEGTAETVRRLARMADEAQRLGVAPADAGLLAAKARALAIEAYREAYCNQAPEHLVRRELVNRVFGQGDAVATIMSMVVTHHVVNLLGEA